VYRVERERERERERDGAEVMSGKFKLGVEQKMQGKEVKKNKKDFSWLFLNCFCCLD